MAKMRGTALFAVLLIAAMSFAGETTYIGYRGDGSNVHTDQKPPTSFDEARQKNIRWKTPLPNWGYSQPIVVKNRVFVTCEAGWPEGQDFPLLLCYDANTGKEQWRRTLDHLPAVVAEDELETVRATWREIMSRHQSWYTLCNEWRHDADTTLAKAKEAGFTVGKGRAQIRSGIGCPTKEYMKHAKTMKRYGLNLDAWWKSEHGVRCIGNAYPTPCSDGENVYVTTGMSSFWCFDVAGNRKWLNVDIYNWYFNTYGGNDYCKNAKSPLLYKDLLITDISGKVRAFDKKTGEMRWSHELGNGHHCIVSPVVITVGKQDFLLCGYASDVAAFTLPGGERVKVLEDTDAPEGTPEVPWRITGGIMLVQHDRRDTVFFSGNGDHTKWGGESKKPIHLGPAGAQCSFKDGVLWVKQLWGGFEGRHIGGNGTIGIVYHDEKLYHQNGFILDADTGDALAGIHDRSGKAKDRAVPQTTSMLVVAGRHVYGLKSHSPAGGDGSQPPRGANGVLTVYTLDGKRVSESVLHDAKSEGEKRRQINANHKYDHWAFSYSAPFTVANNRLYVRSNDYLWCIGK